MDEFKELHQFHRDLEHPFTVLELPSIRRVFGGLELRQLKHELDPALYAFNSKRMKTLCVYPGVRETLDWINAKNIKIVAHTEAKIANALFRLFKLDLLKYFEHIYAPAGSAVNHPEPENLENYKVAEGFVQTVPDGMKKPKSELLFEICKREKVPENLTCYVGDSITRDIVMAKNAGALAIWAKYGTEYDKTLWSVLVRVTHWTDEEVRLEENLRSKYADVKPDHEISEFSELCQILNR